MVGTDNTPDLTVSATDSIKKIMEEYGDELWSMFFFGIIVGILISYGVYCIYKYIQSRKKEEIESIEEQTEITEAIAEETPKTTIENDKKDLMSLLIFGLVAIITLLIGIIIAISM